jgi:hypothetical protein
MKKTALTLLYIIGIFSALSAQKQLAIHIKKATGKITLDGKLNETDWQAAESSSPFWQSLPYDTSLAVHQTEARLTFDEQFLYIGAKCIQKKGKYVVLSLKRDYPAGTTDLLGVLIDPYSDKQNAYSFAVSPYDVQREGLIFNGNVFNTDWDGRWFSKTYNTDNEYFIEIAIPFKTLRYRSNPDANEWNINLLRFDQSQPQAERSTWSPLPRFSNGNNIAFAGKLIWETPPPPSGRNIALIPYTLANTDRDILAKKDWKGKINAGFDAKIALSSAMNLDLTANPDFAQVEVDKQVTNLSRFELFFPERRQFFLENADLFGNFGLESVNPFFSRRVGLAKDKMGNNINVPIAFGARLTGKLNQKWRVGILNMQTQAKPYANIEATNFLATAIQRKVFARSLLSLVYVNRQNFLSDSTHFLNQKADNQGFNRVIGTDFNLASKNGYWQGKAFAHRSFSAKAAPNPYSMAATMTYNTNTVNFNMALVSVGEGYNAEVGYVPRVNFLMAKPSASFFYYPKSHRINSISAGIDGEVFFRKSDQKLSDYYLSPLVFNMVFQNNAKLNIIPARWDYTYLLKAFDPTNTNGKELTENTDYQYINSRVTYSSDTRKHFFWTATGRTGKYFNGNLNALQSTFSYRYQPYGVFSLDVNYNKINLPTGYNDRTLWLIGPRFDVSFTKSLFLTTFIQYNNQINNVNVNARFQWRFAPVSDLFIVYTENYFATDAILPNMTTPYHSFESKNRAVVLKCTYWLNL